MTGSILWYPVIEMSIYSMTVTVVVEGDVTPHRPATTTSSYDWELRWTWSEDWAVGDNLLIFEIIAENQLSVIFSNFEVRMLQKNKYTVAKLKITFIYCFSSARAAIGIRYIQLWNLGKEWNWRVLTFIKILQGHSQKFPKKKSDINLMTHLRQNGVWLDSWAEQDS